MADTLVKNTLALEYTSASYSAMRFSAQFALNFLVIKHFQFSYRF